MLTIGRYWKATAENRLWRSLLTERYACRGAHCAEVARGAAPDYGSPTHPPLQSESDR